MALLALPVPKAIPPPTPVATLLMKVELSIWPLAPFQLIPPLLALAVLLIKVVLVKVPLLASQKRAPPKPALLLVKVELVIAPLVPVQ